MTNRTEASRHLHPVPARACLGGTFVHVLISAYAMMIPISAVAFGTQAVLYLILAMILFGVQCSRGEHVACAILIGAATIALAFNDRESQVVQAAADAALVAAGFLVLTMAFQLMLRTLALTLAPISSLATIYLSASVACTIGIHALEALHPESLGLSGRATPINAGELSNFSFVTPTTLGCGDMSPVTPVARSHATPEAVFGQAFDSVFLGRLVSIYATQQHPSHTGRFVHAINTPRSNNE